MPIVTLTPDEATQALEAVFALHGAATIELDYDHAVLVGLELRLTDHDREVPRDAWPDIARWIHECPGLNHQLSPRRRFTGDDACQLWWQITGYRIWLMHQPEPDALELLACEGLLNVIRSEGEVTPTGRLLELVEAVRAA